MRRDDPKSGRCSIYAVERFGEAALPSFRPVHLAVALISAYKLSNTETVAFAC